MLSPGRGQIAQITGDLIGPYELHDFFLYRRSFSQQFKNSCMPDRPHIDNVPLSSRGDWRMPSDAAWRE